jgi:hypothetical protein
VAFGAVAQAVLDHVLDFPALFGQIANGAYELPTAELPRLPFSDSEPMKRVEAGSLGLPSHIRVLGDSGPRHGPTGSEGIPVP